MSWRRLGPGVAVLALLVPVLVAAGAAGLPADGAGPSSEDVQSAPAGGDPAPEPDTAGGEPGDPGPGEVGGDGPREEAGDAPVAAEAEVEPDGSSKATLRAETGPAGGSDDGAAPGAGAAALAPRGNGSVEAGAATFPEPGGECRETPVARLYLVAFPEAAATSAGPPAAAWNGSLEDPRDHPAWRCSFGGEAGRVAAGGGEAPSLAPPAPEAGAAGAPVPAEGAPAPPSPTVQPGGKPRSGAPREVVEVDAAAARSPVERGWAPGAAVLALAALAVPAAVALYRRLTRDELLENETRRAILGMVRDRPGLTAAEARDELDVHYETARHHLDLLEEFGEVEAVELGGRVRYFENHQRFGRTAKHLVACLGSETKRAILMAIARSGALPSGGVADEVGVAPSTASYHLGDLEEQGLVEGRPAGRSVLYSLEDGVLPALIELAPAPGEDR